MDVRELVIKKHDSVEASREKHCYFLLAAVGACIGFAVTQSKGQTLNWAHVPLAVAIACWGLSFYTGMRSIWEATTHSTIDALGITADHDLDPAFRAKTEKDREDAAKLVEDALAESNKKLSRFRSWQFGSFVTGSIAFLLWHTVEMLPATAKAFLHINP